MQKSRDQRKLYLKHFDVCGVVLPLQDYYNTFAFEFKNPRCIWMRYGRKLTTDLEIPLLILAKDENNNHLLLSFRYTLATQNRKRAKITLGNIYPI